MKCFQERIKKKGLETPISDLDFFLDFLEIHWFLKQYDSLKLRVDLNKHTEIENMRCSGNWLEAWKFIPGPGIQALIFNGNRKCQNQNRHKLRTSE